MHASSGIPTHEPDSSCLSPRGDCDRQLLQITTWIYGKQFKIFIFVSLGGTDKILAQIVAVKQN